MDWDEFKNLDLAEIGQWPRPAKLLVWGFMLFFIGYMSYQLLIEEQINALGQAQREERMLKLQFENKYRMAARLALQKDKQPPTATNNGSNTVATLLEEISRAGTRSGLEFLLFQPEAEIKGKDYTELPIRIRVAGNYHSFGHFVSDLAALPQAFSLQELHISHSTQKAAVGVSETRPLVMELVAKRYRLQASGKQAAGG